MESATSQRVRRDVVRLVHLGLDTPDFARAVTRTLRRAVPMDGSCLLTTDPATLLATGEVVDHGLPAEVLPRLFQIEHSEPDFNKFTRLARSARTAASLSEATAGNLERSRRQRELRRPSGFADELRAVCRDGSGTWGALTLLRETGRPEFTPAEVRLVASLSGLLAAGIRRAAAAGISSGTSSAVDGALTPGLLDGAEETGLLVLDEDGNVELSNDAAESWLGELADTDPEGAELPLVVRAVAYRARAAAAAEPDPPAAAGSGRSAAAGSGRSAFAESDPPAAAELSPTAAADSGRLARARVRLPSGRWLVVRGSLMRGGPRVAIMLESARPPELAPLIADAYGLTDRERLVTELVARGFSTNEIADRLHLSAYTIQDHLKSIFEKSGTASRGDLVARLFIDHYAPHLTTT